MPQAAIDEKTIRDKLKTKRKLLFEKFRRNPSNTHLAVEIRSIDDPITYLTRGISSRSNIHQSIGGGDGENWSIFNHRNKDGPPDFTSELLLTLLGQIRSALRQARTLRS